MQKGSFYTIFTYQISYRLAGLYIDSMSLYIDLYLDHGRNFSTQISQRKTKLKTKKNIHNPFSKCCNSRQHTREGPFFINISQNLKSAVHELNAYLFTRMLHESVGAKSRTLSGRIFHQPPSSPRFL